MDMLTVLTEQMGSQSRGQAKWGLWALCALMVAACGKSSEDGDPNQVGATDRPAHWVSLDVSDVAFLWPRLQGASFGQLLPITGAGALPSIVPSAAHIDTLIQFSLGQAPGGGTQFPLTNPQTGVAELASAPTDSWRPFRAQDVRVVSARVEDCGAGLRQFPGPMGLLDTWVRSGSRVELHRDVFETCTASLRLVAQPPTGDNAIHLIYTYTDTSILRQMMEDLQAIKAASPAGTNGHPLGVHPGLQRENGVGPFSTKVKAFIIKYARPEKLDTIAFLSTNEAAGGGQWNFFEAKPVQTATGVQWQANPLLALEGRGNSPHASPISQGFTVQTSDPVRNGPPALANSVQNGFSMPAIEANFDPRRSFATATDCKSCHFATQLVARNARSGGDQFSQIFASPDSVMDTPGVTSFPHSSTIPIEQNNFRSFGWFQGPTVSAWVAKKAGAVALSLNKMFLGESEGPGYRCTGRQHLVMKCLLQNAGQQSDCLQRFCERP